MSALRSLLVLGALAGAARAEVAADEPVSAERHALSVAANTQGFRLYRKNQLPRAALRFRDATMLDPSYVLAHYNLACMASRLRDVPTLLGELAWLQASTDPLAAAKLDKARGDADLDFASALPKVRALLRMAPLDPRAPIPWLAERHGVWSVELPTADCAARTYSFVFAASGAVSLTVRESCDGAPARAHTFDGHATPDGDGIRVTVDGWPLWPDGVRLTLAACPGLPDAPASCFTLESDSSQIGPFHRGAPGFSPMSRRPAARVTSADTSRGS